MRVRRRLEQERLKQGDVKKNFECPVYLCYCKFATEDDLITHYNEKHKELVELGLTLRKSKKTRREEKEKKMREMANKIQIETDLNKKKEAEQEQSSDNSDLDEDSNEEFGKDQDNEQIDLYGPNGRGLMKLGVDGDIDNDSDLEDLLAIEKMQLEKKKRREERRQTRRQQRGGVYDDQNEYGHEDDDDENSQDENADELDGIQELI